MRCHDAPRLLSGHGVGNGGAWEGRTRRSLLRPLGFEGRAASGSGCGEHALGGAIAETVPDAVLGFHHQAKNHGPSPATERRPARAEWYPDRCQRVSPSTSWAPARGLMELGMVVSGFHPRDGLGPAVPRYRQPGEHN